MTKNFEQLWLETLDKLGKFRVKSVCYGILASRREMDARGLTPALYIKTNHPESWQTAFAKERLLNDDETAVRCIAGETPIFWDQNKASRHQNPRIRARAAIEVKAGLTVGVSLPAAMFGPNRLGGIGMAFDMERKDFRQHWTEHGDMITAICSALDTQIRATHMASMLKLRPQEVECLSWIAAGLRPGQIAVKTKFTVKMVSKHLGQAKTKLGAATRDHAVVKAMTLGIITP